MGRWHQHHGGNAHGDLPMVPSPYPWGAARGAHNRVVPTMGEAYGAHHRGMPLMGVLMVMDRCP